MKFHVVTLFPEMIESALQFGVVGQAIRDGRLSVTTLSPRTFTENVHHTVDDRPFGGGDGMVMIPEPLSAAIRSLQAPLAGRRVRTIHLSPRGKVLNDRKLRELANCDDLILVSSRYGGADQRLLNTCVDEEISVGDYVLSGGELAALILIDGVGRLLPGVLGNERSAHAESFSGDLGLLEHPQFTRPRAWEGSEVPAEYLSGDHAKIEVFQKVLSLMVTIERRPDLLKQAEQPAHRKLWESAAKVANEISDETWKACGLRTERTQMLGELNARLAKFPSERKVKK
jgi:tRNA (guanine37-N1)-methyltransferase